jgi:hypothetical protein
MQSIADLNSLKSIYIYIYIYIHTRTGFIYILLLSLLIEEGIYIITIVDFTHIIIYLINIFLLIFVSV